MEDRSFESWHDSLSGTRTIMSVTSVDEKKK